ncbi:MAG: sugar nucleotide-binding protein [Fibrobacteres bacterium]|nr:sugar nucleotide-binding protein [Fibrobacterota bacterium]
MKRILILGGSGFVGSNLLEQISKNNGYSLFSTYNSALPTMFALTEWQQIDLCSGIDLKEYLADINPDCIINLTCLPVNACDEDPLRANLVQVDAVETIARFCGNSKRLIHLSTDMVFSGNKGSLYNYDDAPDPVSGYGRTKLLGEEAVLKYSHNSVIVRSALVLGRSKFKKAGFTEWMIGRLEKNEQLPLFIDQYRTPIIVEALCDLICNLVESDWCGIMHAGGGTRLNRVQMGEALIRGMGLSTDLIYKTLMPELSGISRMQRDLSMSNNIFNETLEIKWGNPISYLERIGKEIKQKS